MLSTKEELLETIEKIRNIPILVVGDIILDRYIWGSVERVSDEAPVPIVKVSKLEDRLGGAANVVHNLRSLEARVSLCGLVGNDDEGTQVLSLLDLDSVQKDGVIMDRSRPTTVKTRIIGRSQQLVRIDREETGPPAIALREALAAAVDAHIDPCKAVILSDYGKGSIGDAMMRRFREAKDAKRIGLESRPLVVDPHPTNFDIYQGVSAAKPNRREAEIASGIRITDRASALEAGKILMKKWSAPLMIMSLGADGLMLLGQGAEQGIFLETVAREVYDVSGAGDTVTAVFTAAMAAGASPPLAGDLANIAAGVVVSEVGTVAVNLNRLRLEIDRLYPRT